MNWATRFAALSVVSGLVAAWYWYQSTKPTVPPVLDDGGVMRAMKWFEGVKNASDQAAEANRKAALWSAATVLLGAISTFLAALGSN
jgi:hypothetical protein